MNATASNQLKARGVNQEPSSLKNLSAVLNIIPFLCAATLAILLWIFTDFKAYLSIILIYYVFIDNPHLYASYPYIKNNQILRFKNPYFWGALCLCCLPLILFLGQIPFVEDNSIKAQIFLFQVFMIAVANFHRARQHWGVLKKISQLSPTFSKYVNFTEQTLILSILFLPYTYIFSSSSLYMSYVQNFSIDFNSKLLAIQILLIVWISIEVSLFVLGKAKPIYERIGFTKKITTVIRRSFLSICVLWIGYAFYDQSVSVFLFVSNVLITILALGLLIKMYELKFNTRLIFILELLFFQVFITYLARESAFANTLIYIANACIHSVQYLIFVTWQETVDIPKKKRNLFVGNFSKLFSFTLILGALLYLSQTVTIEVINYAITLVYLIFSTHHIYLDSIIWRKDAAKYLAMPG